MIDDKFKVDHLFLLVGTNPLPNYVAARLLLKEAQQSTIIFIYSKGTCEERQRLEDVLRAEGFSTFINRLVEESNPDHIINQVKETVLPAGKVGLHYSGGTKAMAVHAYRTLEHMIAEKRITDVQFSYLDAQKIQLIFTSLGNIPVGVLVPIALRTLLNLHSREAKLKTSPLWPQTAQAIADIHADTELRQQWNRWTSQTFFQEPVCPTPQAQDLSERDAEWMAWVREQFVWQEYRRRRWKGNGAMGQMPVHCPDTFATVEQALRNETPLSAAATFRDLMRQGGFSKAEDLGKWFEGTWLESYVLHQVQQLQQDKRYAIHDSACSINVFGDQNVEIDVAFMCGYQLFALSCTSSSERHLCKAKLLEVVVRAAQLGGDEARAGLICCSDTPEALEREVFDLLGKKVRVFGWMHLAALRSDLAHWIEDVSGQRSI